MSIHVEGTVERQAFGPGTWALVTTSQETYELLNPPAALQNKGLRVSISGRVREDVMTIAMIGPVLEVQQFEILNS
jgi:hypothetical protein